MRSVLHSCQWLQKPAAKATPTTPQPSTTRPYHSPPQRGQEGAESILPMERVKASPSQKTDSRIPSEIRAAGGTASTPDGDPICFDSSLKKCKETVTDGRCRKGYHLCCICYGPHCMMDHKKA